MNGVVEVDGVTKEAADETPAEQKGSHILPLLTCLSIPSWLNAYYSFRPNI